MNDRQYEIVHVGWLLACDSPKNIAKGEAGYAKLPPEDQPKALAYRDKCVMSYESVRG